MSTTTVTHLPVRTRPVFHVGEYIFIEKVDGVTRSGNNGVYQICRTRGNGMDPTQDEYCLFESNTGTRWSEASTSIVKLIDCISDIYTVRPFNGTIKVS